MIKPYKGYCKICEHNNKWIKNTRQECEDCVYRKNHGGKSRFEVYKQNSNPKKRKKTGDLELFKEIRNERTHYCVKCSKWLGHNLKPMFFSHIKSKGAYPELRMDKSNIELLCAECHYIYEFGDRSKLE